MMKGFNHFNLEVRKLSAFYVNDSDIFLNKNDSDIFFYRCDSSTNLWAYRLHFLSISVLFEFFFFFW